MRTFLVLVVFLSVDCTVHVAGDCPRPTPGPNMVLVTNKTFPVSEGTAVSFQCETRYRRVGPSSVVCFGGRWTKINMKCEKRNCGSAVEVLNGYVDYSEGTEVGALATVVCNKGYTPFGTVKLYCGVNGWMDRPAECEVDVCSTPDSIANGYFSPVKDEYQYSESVTYSCNGEYVLNGSTTATCEDRQFKPAPPTCVLVNCPDPRVNNSVVAGGTQPPYKYMSSVTLRCNTGYKMEGRDTVSCDINSEWSPALPRCNPVECRAPEIRNGEVEDDPHPTYRFSETINVKCSKGYKLTGQSTLTCGERNQWSPAVPECTQIQCQTPQVAGGVLVGGQRPSYKYLDTVVFECELGHNLRGVNTVTCDVNGQWSPELPQCTPVECKSVVVMNAEVRASRIPSQYLDSVVVECNSGYTPTGQSTLKCDHNSQWSPEPPVCTQKNADPW